jgi:hypothetical protein
MMLLPDPEYPWKWYKWLAGQPSAYFGFSTVGSGTILHKEHLMHFCISGSKSLSLDKDMLFTSWLRVKQQDSELYMECLPEQRPSTMASRPGSCPEASGG